MVGCTKARLIESEGMNGFLVHKVSGAVAHLGR
jgi:hypothetical protein